MEKNTASGIGRKGPLRTSRKGTLVWTARLATLAAPVVSVLYGLALVGLAKLTPFSIHVGAFQGMSILLLPLLLSIAVIAWITPLAGGILVMAVGIVTVVNILSAHGWPAYYTIPYLILCAVFITGVMLHIVGAFWKASGPLTIRQRDH
ncbi:MAG: hypothetical protein Q7T05_06135 [Dehalococcoidia bacterium]|nr:hypothetical protein [Dehalococcoidia bacterium]